MTPILRRTAVVLVAASFLGATGCPIMWAQKDVIEARVVDARSGKPVAGALIQGKGLIEANGGQSVRTDRSGRFALTSLRYGDRPGGFFMEGRRSCGLPYRLKVRAPGYASTVVDAETFEHERDSSSCGGQGTNLHRAWGEIKLIPASRAGEDRESQAYGEDELIRAIGSICWLYLHDGAFSPDLYFGSKQEVISLVMAFAEDRDVINLAEFFVHPAYWSRDRKTTEYAADVQGLILAMEARPGKSAATWNEFQRKVAARWGGEQPRTVQEVVKLYGSLSGAQTSEKEGER